LNQSIFNYFTLLCASIEGWGTTAFLGSSSPSLREVEVPIWNNQACLEAIGKNVFDTTLCAGGRIKSADACQVRLLSCYVIQFHQPIALLLFAHRP
jgi:hypothetical protein